MANTKTQKLLSISKSKSENISEWIVNEAHWKLLAENLGLGKTAIFRYKKLIKEMGEEKTPFYALGEVFTLNQLNVVIELFNDAIEHPEKYEKPKKKAEVNLQAQAEVIQKHTQDMNMDYLGYKNKKIASTKGDETKETGTDYTRDRALTQTEVLKRHMAEKEYIQTLPEGSQERIERERAYRESEADRIAEYWRAQTIGHKDKKE
ncbi:hypothetical protein TP70_02035 [Staphylococcus microti]|uniref:Uncharacterized protein n=1 Tax=Staphylococcus microti TaxID=569857 RepID=A0A0D6XRR8_9STAP|nr:MULTISPECIES: hypothetical protein [Staphylococcus]KIR10387.1 hypothetical protein SH09_13505 [Staphylococcus gallinarum]KIX91499.1 hypothetical protein TP70_02035 [Staphylococcus microti]PNZ84136.1 hypothetical protein CD132_01160 [Staphylococcus microti]SUN02204.1 Uncharacterised protein [Staphylococcus microti]